MTNNDGSLFGSSLFYVTEDTTSSHTMNSLMNSCMEVLNTRYAEVGRSIATDDDSLIRNIGNLVNQQIAVIEESNRYMNDIDDFMHSIVEEPSRRHHSDRETTCQGQH